MRLAKGKHKLTSYRQPNRFKSTENLYTNSCTNITTGLHQQLLKRFVYGEKDLDFDMLK